MTEPVSNADSKAIGQEIALSAMDVAPADTLLVVLDSLHFFSPSSLPPFLICFFFLLRFSSSIAPLDVEGVVDMMKRMIIVALLVTIEEDGIIRLVLDVPIPGRTLLVVLIAPVLRAEEHHHLALRVLPEDPDHQEDRLCHQEERLHRPDDCHQAQGDHQKEEFLEDPLPQERFPIHLEELDHHLEHQ